MGDSAILYRRISVRRLDRCGACRGERARVRGHAPLRDLLGLQRFRDLGHQSIFVAIGPVSENALKAVGVSRILLAADSTVFAAVAILSEYFAKAGPHQPAGAKRG